MEQKHYVCEGSCMGESNQPGVCKTETCELFGQQMKPCHCEDGMHDDHEIEAPEEDADLTDETEE
jgi:hypothetical protein